MARLTRAAPHLSAEELKTRLKLDPRPWCRQRWLIIYNALVEPREAAEIAKHTGTTVAMVHRVIASYNRLGVVAVETRGKGGRRRESMSWEEEQAFLAPFFTRAQRGEIATADAHQTRECAPRSATRCTKVRSRGCSSGMAGANPFPGRSIPKPIPSPKQSLKKLRGYG